jgi:hypothetical protein
MEAKFMARAEYLDGSGLGQSRAAAMRVVC